MRRGYTLVELAVAAFATMLMVAAMARWTFDVAAFTQSTLMGRDDSAASAAHRLLDEDAAGAVFCLTSRTSARVAWIDEDRVVFPAVATAEGFERVEWRVEPGPDGLMLRRAGTPVRLPGGFGADLGCWEESSPSAQEWGTLVSGLDEGSGFRFPGLTAAPPVLCLEEWSAAACRPDVVEMVLFRDGGEYFRRSLLGPSAR